MYAQISESISLQKVVLEQGTISPHIITNDLKIKDDFIYTISNNKSLEQDISKRIGTFARLGKRVSKT